MGARALANLTPRLARILHSRTDPTRSVVLRRRFMADASMRFRGIRADIRTSVLERDALGLTQLVAHAAAAAREFAYTWDHEKVDSFMKWLREQERKGVLEIVHRPGGGSEPWSNIYIRSSYVRGLAEARARMRAAGVNIPSFESIPGGQSAVFQQPFNANRVGLIYTRAYDSLKGVTEAMNVAISRELAMGMASGLGPYQIAKNLADRVDKIGITRARLIARTEITLAHNVAQLAEYESAEQTIGKTVRVMWWTAQDERVRPTHAERHGVVYDREDALPLLGEPNCRCSLLPVVGDEGE